MKPILQALLLADRVYLEKSGKFIVVGIFDQWLFKKLPERPSGQPGEVQKVKMEDVQDAGNPWVYFSVTDVKGEAKLELRYEKLDGSELIFSTELVVRTDSPIGSVKMGLPVPKLPQVPGWYVLDLLFEGESIGTHRVECKEIE